MVGTAVLDGNECRVADDLLATSNCSGAPMTVVCCFYRIALGILR
jgi:hypothetical protein